MRKNNSYGIITRIVGCNVKDGKGESNYLPFLFIICHSVNKSEPAMTMEKHCFTIYDKKGDEMKLLCMIKKIVRDIIEDAIKHMIEDKEEQRVIYRVIKNIPVVSLFQYVPKSVDDSNDAERQHNRELLWSFKDGKDDDIMWAVIESFTKVIRKLLENDTHDVALAFLPASDLRATDRRWRRFSMILSDVLGCHNGYKHLRPKRDSVPRHYIGGRGVPRALDVDEDYFDGKRVVLIDDLVNSGRTFRNAVKTLRGAGADVILGLSVATT